MTVRSCRGLKASVQNEYCLGVAPESCTFFVDETCYDFSFCGMTLCHMQTHQVMCASMEVASFVSLARQHALAAMCIKMNPIAEQVQTRWL